jgi:predicted DCC family thiol-disulfide oxidoreductase YuxK
MRAALLFDGTCGPCTRLANWVRRQDRDRRLEVIPNQAPGALERYGVSRAEADRAAWLVEPDGRRLEGAAAMSRTLELIGGGWQILALPHRLGAAAALEEAAYRWVARNRQHLARFGVTPECDLPDNPCGV